MTRPAEPLDPQAKRDSLWMCAAIALVAVMTLGIHFASGVRALSSVRDEPLMKAPIDAILEKGWTMETAIDYQEVKGPVFFWMYAAPGEVTGGSMNALRLVSIACVCLGAIALLLIARACGNRRSGLLAVGVLYILAPYNTFTAQLLMSEPSFICLALWLMWVYLWGSGGSTSKEHRLWGPVIFAVILALLLHHRPHALALAGAVAATAVMRERLRAWPWIAACAAAGLARLPLYLRWGGMVTSDYQDLFGFGLRVDGLTYMLAAVLPWTGMFIVGPLVFNRDSGSRRTALVWIGAVGVAAFVVALLARPDLDARVEYVLPGQSELKSQAEYAGVIATAIKAVIAPGVLRSFVVAACAGAGAASLAGLWISSRSAPSTTTGSASAGALVLRLAFWTLACGLPLYIITAGPVYDRYLAVWTVLLPVAWFIALPRPLLIAQMFIHGAMLGRLVIEWLVP